MGGVVGVYLCKSSSAQIEGVLHQTANNTAEIKRLEGSVQHISHGARAAEVAVARALKLLHAQARRGV